MAGLLSSLLFASVVFDHSLDIGVHSVYLDKTYYHGHEICYTGHFLLDSHSWKFSPRQYHFHDGSCIYSLEIGPEFFIEGMTLGIKGAYDLSTMSGRTFQQASVGLEIDTEYFDFAVTHYSPWPASKSIGDQICTAYSHTGFDFINKMGKLRLGFAPYFIEKEVGTKLSFELPLWSATISGHWKFDKINEHSFTLGISFGFLSPKKSKSKHIPFVMTKTTSAAASDFLTTSMVASSRPLALPVEESIKKEEVTPEKSQEDNGFLSFFFNRQSN